MSELLIHTEELTRLLAPRQGSTDAVTERLRWLLHFAQCRSVSTTCRAFGISRPTFYRWAERFNPADLSTLEDRPTRLDHVRRTEFPSAVPATPPVLPAPIAKPVADAPCCFWCRVRLRDWRSMRRTVFLASVLSNVALVAALIGFALFEMRAHGATQAASIIQESSSLPFDLP